MNLFTIRRPLAEGNSRLKGHRYVNTYELEIGWNRIKVNVTEYNKGLGFQTWYPFSFYWWPSYNQWRMRWRQQLGPRIRRKPTPGVIG